MIIFWPNMIWCWWFQSEKYEKNQALSKSPFCMKMLKARIHTNKKHGKPTLHSFIANHVLEMSVNWNSCVFVLERSYVSALLVLNSFLTSFYQAPLKSRINELFVFRLKIRARDFAYTLDIFRRSDDPFLRIRFLVPKTGSRRSEGPISRSRFCGENVGRSFVVCSHDPFFRTNKECSI